MSNMRAQWDISPYDLIKLDELITIWQPEGKMTFTQWAEKQGYTLTNTKDGKIEMIVEYGGL